MKTIFKDNNEQEFFIKTFGEDLLNNKLFNTFVLHTDKIKYSFYEKNLTEQVKCFEFSKQFKNSAISETLGLLINVKFQDFNQIFFVIENESLFEQFYSLVFKNVSLLNSLDSEIVEDLKENQYLNHRSKFENYVINDKTNYSLFYLPDVTKNKQVKQLQTAIKQVFVNEVQEKFKEQTISEFNLVEFNQVLFEINETINSYFKERIEQNADFYLKLIEKANKGLIDVLK